MNTKPTIKEVNETNNTSITSPNISVETIRFMGMVQLSLMASVGIVRDVPLPLMLLLMLGVVLFYPWQIGTDSGGGDELGGDA